MCQPDVKCPSVDARLVLTLLDIRTMLGELTYFDAALAFLAFILLKIIANRYKQRRRYPPGPKGLPFIGNVLQMPKAHEWLAFAGWGEQYGIGDCCLF